MLTEQQARSKAEKLLVNMKSPGWGIRVWENLGWHYSLQRGTLNLHEYEYDYNQYQIFYSDVEGGVGELSVYGICNGHYSEPNLAVEEALAKASKYVKELIKILNINREAHGLKPVYLSVSAPEKITSKSGSRPNTLSRK